MLSPAVVSHAVTLLVGSVGSGIVGGAQIDKSHSGTRRAGMEQMFF